MKTTPIGLADRRMVGHLLVDAETEEPSIGEVRLNLLHGLTNGTDVEQRPEEDDLGIDAGRPGVRIERGAEAVDDREIDVAVEFSDEMIPGDQLVQRGLRPDRFVSFLRMGAVHIGFLLLMTDGLGVYLPFPIWTDSKYETGFFFGRRGLRKRQTAAR